jgi:hypothetical protein
MVDFCAEQNDGFFSFYSKAIFSIQKYEVKRSHPDILRSFVYYYSSECDCSERNNATFESSFWKIFSLGLIKKIH